MGIWGPLIGSALGAGLGAALGGGKGTEKYASLPESRLPSIEESLRGATTFRNRITELMGRDIDPSRSREVLQPFALAELSRIRESGRQTKGALAGQAEGRGMTFSDIALGNIAGVDQGVAQSEMDINAELLRNALAMEQAQRGQEFGFFGSQIDLFTQMALARDAADTARLSAGAASGRGKGAEGAAGSIGALAGLGAGIGSFFGRSSGAPGKGKGTG